MTGKQRASRAKVRFLRCACRATQHSEFGWQHGIYFDSLIRHPTKRRRALIELGFIEGTLQDAVRQYEPASAGAGIMLFREEPVTPVYRRWMCEQIGCYGELLSTGEGITRLDTRWKHRCAKCGYEDWADASYPRVAYLPIDAIGPDDTYT